MLPKHTTRSCWRWKLYGPFPVTFWNLFKSVIFSPSYWIGHTLSLPPTFHTLLIVKPWFKKLITIAISPYHWVYLFSLCEIARIRWVSSWICQTRVLWTDYVSWPSHVLCRLAEIIKILMAGLKDFHGISPPRYQAKGNISPLVR